MKINLEEIDKIYSNQMGITFFWKNEIDAYIENKRVNIIFSNVALLFNIIELNLFLQDIENSLYRNSFLEDKHRRYYDSIVLETPINQLRFILSYNDLSLLKDLIERTIFDIEVSNMLHEIL